MKIILYNAITIDGYIATSTGDTEWVSLNDVPFFEAEIKKAGCIIVGRKTFDQYEGEVYPIKDVFNVVVTTNSALTSKYENALYHTGAPQELIALLEQKGFTSALLVGGGEVNGSFLKEGLIDEIFIDIHPYVFGNGIKLFEDSEVFDSFEKVSLQELKDGLILVHYTKSSKVK